MAAVRVGLDEVGAVLHDRIDLDRVVGLRLERADARGQGDVRQAGADCEGADRGGGFDYELVVYGVNVYCLFIFSKRMDSNRFMLVLFFTYLRREGGD